MQVTGPEFWTALERASWVITALGVLGLVAALVQLGLVYREQRRIATQLTAAPKISMGFMKPGLTPSDAAIVQSHTIPVRWSPDESMSEHVVLGFGIANTGDRTAGHLYHEVTFRASVADVFCDPRDGDYYSDDAGIHHVIWHPEELHPKAGVTHYFRLKIDSDVTQLQINSLASFHDSPWVRATITLDLSSRPARTRFSQLPSSRVAEF